MSRVEIHLRMKSELYRKIKDAASKNNTTENKEIVTKLEEIYQIKPNFELMETVK